MAKVSYNAVGRRKKAVARVRLVAGEGKIVINKRDIDNYFGLETLKMTARQPLTLTNTTSFDVLVNVCGGGVSWRSGEGRLTKIPVWAFHGDADSTVPPVNSIENVDRINAAGGNAKLTLFHGVGHNSWDPAYCETNVIEWMLAQKKKH